jgi:hypothetical protein
MPNVWPETHPDFPWYKGQASFFLVDAKVAAQFATHAKKHGGNHNCSFCQSLARKNANAIAVVNLTDAEGNTLRIDARELFDLNENATVVVRGKARLLAGRLLVIDADGIYVQDSSTIQRSTFRQLPKSEHEKTSGIRGERIDRRGGSVDVRTRRLASRGSRQQHASRFLWTAGGY